MILILLVVIAVIGVSLVVGAVHLTGGSASGRLVDTESVTEIFLTDFPDYTVKTVVISDDHKNALLLDDSTSHAGLVSTAGVHRLTRILDRDLLKSVVGKGEIIELELADMAVPAVQFRISDRARLQEIVSILGSVANPDNKDG